MEGWLYISMAVAAGMGVAVGSLLLRGIASWLQKRWKPGVERVAYAIGWLVVGFVGISVVSTRFAAAEATKADGPAEQAILISGAISHHMNAWFVGCLLGVTLGLWLERRARAA